GDRDNLHRLKKGAAEAFDEKKLLPILLSEVGAVRSDRVEKFHHRGQHSVKVAWPEGAGELFTESFFVNGEAEACGIKIVDAANPAGVHTGLAGQKKVPFQGARIVLQIIGVVELRGIDENTEDDKIFCSRLLQETAVALVKSAHGGNKTQRMAIESLTP